MTRPSLAILLADYANVCYRAGQVFDGQAANVARADDLRRQIDAQIIEMTEVLVDLAASDPCFEGEGQCILCGQIIEGGTEHKRDCVWLRARAIVGDAKPTSTEGMG